MWRVLIRLSRRDFPLHRRHFGSGPPRRVAIVGASGRLGSMVGLLLKQSTLVDTLVMCDVASHNCGVGMDISHIDTKVTMMAYTGTSQFAAAFKECAVVLVCAGEARHSCKMSPQELFSINAPTIQHITEAFAESCPKAFLGIITQPINSLVPMATEILKQRGVHDPRKVFGVTCVDMMRATTFAAELGSGTSEPEDMIVPVVGGHCERTMVPLFSQARPCAAARLGKEEKKVAKRLTSMSAGWVITMKDGNGGSVLAPALAVARFTNHLLRALKGDKNINTCAYVSTDAVKGLRFCALPVEINRHGVKRTAMPSMSANEKLCFSQAKCELAKQIELGENYILKAGCTSEQKDLLLNSIQPCDNVAMSANKKHRKN